MKRGGKGQGGGGNVLALIANALRAMVGTLNWEISLSVNKEAARIQNGQRSCVNSWSLSGGHRVKAICCSSWLNNGLLNGKDRLLLTWFTACYIFFSKKKVTACGLDCLKFSLSDSINYNGNCISQAYCYILKSNWVLWFGTKQSLTRDSRSHKNCRYISVNVKHIYKQNNK